MTRLDQKPNRGRLDPARRWPQFAPCLLLGCLALSAALLAGRETAAQTTKANAPAADKLANMELLFCFQGKGSALPYDAGVATEVFRQVPALRQRRVIVTGNSSGSILASYFACFGFSDVSIRYADYRMLHADVKAVRDMEQAANKTLKMLRGKKTEIPHSALNEYIAFALGVQDWKSAQSVAEIVRRSPVTTVANPLIIVAANKEVLDNAVAGQFLASEDYKQFHYENFSVSWKPEVYQFYRERPDRFAQDHPDLRLGPDPRIGKAATFFVDRSMFELLRQIPAEQRTADLRLVESAEDVAMAILASASEPSYFEPIEETHPEKLLVNDRLGDLGCSKRRVYVGGFVMPLVAQDARRMLPGIRVLASGWTYNPFSVRQFLRANLLADVELIAHTSCWWADMEIDLSSEFQKRLVAHDLPADQEFQTGVANARRCLAADNALPLYVDRPEYDKAAERAVWPAGGQEGLTTDSGQLLTLRGLGPLLERTTQ